MKLLNGSHMYVIIGNKGYFKIEQGAVALTFACKLVAKLRIKHLDQSFKIMEPRFCEHGCHLLLKWIDYVGTPDRTCRKQGRSQI